MSNGRLLILTLKGGRNIAAGSGTTYVRISHNGTSYESKPQPGEYPLWHESFKFRIPLPEPDSVPPTFEIKVKKNVPLLPDSTVGLTKFTPHRLYGKFDDTAPLTDKWGEIAGELLFEVDYTTGESSAPEPSAAGKFLGDPLGVKPTPGSPLDMGGDNEFLPSAVQTLPGPAVGALAVGQLDDPSSPTFGIL